MSACTVSPLYGSASAVSGGADAGTAARLSAIAIKPADTRYGQEVRNQLIFLLRGGGGEPASPRYSLDLGVTTLTEAVALRQIADEDEPSAGRVTVSSNYELSDIATGEVVVSGSRAITASFDRPRQEFASFRAERDAENRAARELAELLRLAIAQDLGALAGP